MSADSLNVVDRLEESLPEGEVPMEVLNSRDLYELEKQTVFGKSWVFLAHESEINEPGDYVIRHICDDEFIVTRDENGDVQVFYNTCQHQGMEVCRAEEGNASHFRCPYHGWTYRNTGDLVGVPYQQSAYGEEFDREERSLRSIPQHDVYNELVFGCLDPDAPALEDYLGEYTFYLDYYTGRDPEGMEVRGPQRRIVDANWKLGVVNTIGDDYHVATTHASLPETGLIDAEGGGFLKDGCQVHAGAGGLDMSPGSSALRHYPDEYLEPMREALTSEQWDLVFEENYRPGNSSLLPNTNVLNAGIISEAGESVPFSFIRKWRPLGPDRTEVLSWALIDGSLPEEYKEKMQRAFTLAIGTSGVIEQDDIENWTRMTSLARGDTTARGTLSFNMGLDDVAVDNFAGPGTAYEAAFSESNARFFFRRYLDYLRQGD